MNDMMSRLIKLKKSIDKRKERELIYLLPLIALCAVCYYQSLTFMLHDYTVSYFPALLSIEGIPPESKVFDIYEFNNYIWSEGYEQELSDFYLNSPFLTTLFYPFALIKDAFLSKAIFNAVSIILFILSLRLLARKFLKDQSFILVVLPILFFFPIRNHILFGQLYMLIFALVSFSFLAFERGRPTLGGSLISVAILTKVFPVFYLMPLVFQRRWKVLLITTGVGSLIFLLSLWLSGLDFWYQYLFDVLPKALASESTTDFRSNAQSLDVFFRTLLVRDAYYNPGAIAHNPALYRLVVGGLKAIILAFTLRASYIYRQDLFKLLAIWVSTLFLMQTRTGTYAQILWVLPLIELYRSPISANRRLIFLSVLFVICNLPYPRLIEAPVFITFTRLWLSITLIVLFWRYLKIGLNLRCMAFGLAIMMPLTLKSAFNTDSSEEGAQYVLDEKEYFLIYDFNKENGYLRYHALGGEGKVSVETTIKVSSFDTTACSMIGGQVYYGDLQLTEGPSLKRRPVLINECEVYYLSDQLSRRGAFTLKKISVCD